MSSSQAIIVDDRNTQYLTYNGDWLQSPNIGAYQEYNVTTSSPLQIGASVVFAFNGTSAVVYGTSGINGPLVNCTLDDGISVSFNTTRNTLSYHAELCGVGGLGAGLHTLNISLADSSGMAWYLDYFIYTPSAPSSESLKGAQFFFDDVDPAFQYSGAWSTSDGTQEDMQATLHTALTLNSSVSLLFTGTFVNVYVRLPYRTNLTSIAQVVIDNGPPFVANYPQIADITFDSTTLTSSNYHLFHDSFSSGSHQLIITPMAEQALWLDYVTSGVGTDTSNPPASGPPSSSSTTLTAMSMPSAASMTASNPSRTSEPKSGKGGIIAGGTLGGIACLALIAFATFLWLRSRLRKHSTEEKPYADSDGLPEGAIVPFNAIPGDVTLVTPYDLNIQDADNVHSSGSNEDAVLVREGQGGKAQVSIPVGVTTSSPTPHPSTQQDSTTSPPPPPPPVRQHKDSGVRRLALATPEELPPVYSQK